MKLSNTKFRSNVIFAAEFAFVLLLPVNIEAENPSDSWSPNAQVSDKENSIYSPLGKRDPFRMPAISKYADRDLASIDPLERFGIEQFQLRVILWSSKPHAMIEDPEGTSYIVSEGDIIGKERGKISRILKSSIIVSDKTFNYLGVEALSEKILSLPDTTSEVGLARGSARGYGTRAPATPSSVPVLARPVGVPDATPGKSPELPKAPEVSTTNQTSTPAATATVPPPPDLRSPGSSVPTAQPALQAPVPGAIEVPSVPSPR